MPKWIVFVQPEKEKAYSFLVWGWWKTERGCREVVNAPHVEVFKNRLELWTTWISERHPVLGRGVGTRWCLGFIPIQMILFYRMDSVEKHVRTTENVSYEMLITCFLRTVSWGFVYIHTDALFLIKNDDKLIHLWCLNCSATNIKIFFGIGLWF